MHWNRYALILNWSSFLGLSGLENEEVGASHPEAGVQHFVTFVDKAPAAALLAHHVPVAPMPS